MYIDIYVSLTEPLMYVGGTNLAVTEQDTSTHLEQLGLLYQRTILRGWSLHTCSLLDERDASW